MRIVDRYWSAIRWDCQHVLHFSAYDYFRWEHVGPNANGTPWWQRKRPMEELAANFAVLMNIPGTMTNEAVMNDPDIIEAMASGKDSSVIEKPRIFGHTEVVSLLKTLTEVKIGKSLPRPIIPGLEERKKRKIQRTHSAVEKAQARSRRNREFLEQKRAKAAKR